MAEASNSGNGSSLEQPAEEHDRLAQPVDVEEAPRLAFPVVGIGASAGGLEAYTQLFEVMRADSGMAFVLIQHLPPDRESMIAEIISRRTSIPVSQVEDGIEVKPNHIYVIRPGHTLTIHEGRLHLGDPVEKPGHSRPVDDFFKSLAEEQRERAIAVVMSGMGSNGAAGAQAIKAVGGLCIAQDPDSAQFPSMPRHLIDAGYADYILRPQDIPDVLLAYAGHPYARGEREDARRMLTRDQQHLREILAVLRSRTRQDFGGYKKQTVLRRVQRRMGLNRIIQISEYAKMLRQNPVEVTSLLDDLLIHVTGFFRDPDVWESLRENVVVPMVASRDPDTAVRCWVTACSSGEEAYSLAILLVEECERVGKRLDIKVFATDMAERTLQNARHGVFPGGIEAEVPPDRLERFFRREDAVYRVRQELRELVVFAPQNVLQDPPFSRLDIVTCRNLLIYLEGSVQQRVLALLHFGLREGGALLLGTSETVAGAEDLFEPIDKKARIFRRIGPTRHGSIDFPQPRAVATGDARADIRAGGRPSLGALTARVLLAHHLPAAITIDRDFRIVYFHGDTDPFLMQPRGEATRDLFALLRESVRGAVRSALQRAAAENAPFSVLDGWLETDGGPRQRILVTASPMENGDAADHFVISFQERGDYTPPAPVTAAPSAQGRGDAELLRVRDELQSTVEELQTSNEELKAAHEEMVSINEELQSTNEELETSREEMQSLNEELTTVNAQLQAKMEEHQAARDDLASLLTSTDIAVLFLDTQFRIRRFTPAVKDLVEMIQGDIGRPLSDLVRKFNDPDLVRDCESVLERLSPIEREIDGHGRRWFTRRVLPYRTADNRIDGVVITFQDITERKHAEAEQEKSLEREQVARTDAEAANRVKDEFLATVSHELRTPLAAILLWVKLLLEASADPSNLREGLSAIRNSAEAQRELIEDLLDTSRIIAGKLRLVPREVNALTIVRSAVEAVLPTAVAKRVTINSKLQHDVGVVSADGTRLQQVVWNLLANAVKFTPPGGAIDVALRRINDDLEIQVRDSGLGIEPEFLPRVFDRFRQADSSTTRSQSGLGLGLTITKQLVELHGGTIEATSAGRNQGATFTVRLPLPEFSTEQEMSGDNAHVAVGSLRLTDAKVLVVEDDASTRNALLTLLQNAGATVSAVESAAAALESIRGSTPDVIVSDVGLPIEDGYSLIHKLREFESSESRTPIPAIALTAFARDSDRARALSAGFQQHIIKPVDPDRLLLAVKSLLSK